MSTPKEKTKVCDFCKHCTPYMEFRTLSIEGKPTMGTCPYWTSSKCVLLSLDSCNMFDMADEYSGVTMSISVNKEAELEEKKEALEKMREEFLSSMGEVKETLPYGNGGKKKKKNS